MPAILTPARHFTMPAAPARPAPTAQAPRRAPPAAPAGATVRANAGGSVLLFRTATAEQVAELQAWLGEMADG